MQLRWSGKALSGLARLYEFLAAVDRRAAARVVHSITAAPLRIMEHPRIGEQLEEFKPREARRIFVGKYEMRYEIQKSEIQILRLWHTREDR